MQANRLIEYVEKQGSQYRSNNVILTMGEDFQYTSAAINFHSMDKLIKLVPTHSMAHDDFCIIFFGFTSLACIDITKRHPFWRWLLLHDILF